jgi:hypothetical protein
LFGEGERAVRLGRRIAVAALALGLLVVAGWVYLRQPAVDGLDSSGVRAVEVRFEPWGEDMAVSPGSSTADPEAVAALVAVLRSGAETRDHKCPSRGVITLRKSLGQPLELRFLPGHHADWYEFRYAGKVYRVPRAEFVAAMRRVGVEVPLECP